MSSVGLKSVRKTDFTHSSPQGGGRPGCRDCEGSAVCVAECYNTSSMNSGVLSQLMLYRYRYWVGYGLLALLAIVFFLWQIGSVGPGVTDAAKDSSLVSTGWTWTAWQDSLQVVNLPYILLQKASIFAFGLSPFSVRLPSALIGLSSCLLFFLLMKRLHKPYVAIIASALFIAASWHVAFGRAGVALAMVPFMWLLVLYSFVRLTRMEGRGLLWGAIAGLSGILALYTPYGAYVLLTCLLVVLVHPDIRRRARSLGGPQIALALVVALPLLTPLGWGVYKNPAQLWELFGLASQLPSPGDFVRNIFETMQALVWSAPYVPSLRLGSTPLLDIGTAALLIAGLYRCIADIKSMRSQFILCASLIVGIILGLHPGQKTYDALLVPIYLIVAAGVTMLFSEWYKLFPRNPYARSFGLVPIVVLLVFIGSYHYQRYFVAWAGAPPTYQAYDDDLTLVQQQLTAHPSLVLAVQEPDLPFYRQMEPGNPNLSVTTIAEAPPDRPLLSAVALPRPAINPEIQTLTPIANDDGQGALRFWLAAPVDK